MNGFLQTGLFIFKQGILKNAGLSAIAVALNMLFFVDHISFGGVAFLYVYSLLLMFLVDISFMIFAGEEENRK